jgi:hypothetical protein
LVKLGRVALDGTRVQGNSAIERKQTRAQLEAAVQEMLAAAEAVDQAEDAQHGLEVRGDELPEELRSANKRLQKLKAALAKLDEDRDKLREAQQQLIDEREKRDRRRRGRKPKDPRSIDLPSKTTVNTTDPESQILSTRRGWVQGYNAQAMTDCASQVVVAQQITQDHNDVQQLATMLERCEEQAGARPEMLLADAGYWSDDNSKAGGEKTTLLLALPTRPKTVKSDASPERKAMESRLGEKANQEAYAQRKSTIEPVFGQIRTRGLRSFHLRGKAKAALEWSLWCTTHNLLKLWRARRAPMRLATA